MKDKVELIKRDIQESLEPGSYIFSGVHRFFTDVRIHSERLRNSPNLGILFDLAVDQIMQFSSTGIIGWAHTRGLDWVANLNEALLRQRPTHELNLTSLIHPLTFTAQGDPLEAYQPGSRVVLLAEFNTTGGDLTMLRDIIQEEAHLQVVGAVALIDRSPSLEDTKKIMQACDLSYRAVLDFPMPLYDEPEWKARGGTLGGEVLFG